jgi:hypothetical protein
MIFVLNGSRLLWFVDFLASLLKLDSRVASQHHFLYCSQGKAASPPLDTMTPMTWLMTTLAIPTVVPRVERDRVRAARAAVRVLRERVRKEMDRVRIITIMDMRVGCVYFCSLGCPLTRLSRVKY